MKFHVSAYKSFYSVLLYVGYHPHEMSKDRCIDRGGLGSEQNTSILSSSSNISPIAKLLDLP